MPSVYMLWCIYPSIILHSIIYLLPSPIYRASFLDGINKRQIRQSGFGDAIRF